MTFSLLLGCGNSWDFTSNCKLICGNAPNVFVFLFFFLWVSVGSRESLKMKRAECNNCTLVAFFTMVSSSSVSQRPSEPGTESVGWDPLAVKHSTVLLDGQCSQRLTLCFTVSDATLDFLLTSHIFSFLQGQGCSDFWWRTGTESNRLLWTLPRLVDNSWFPSFSCSPLWSSQLVSGTVKYLTAVSPAYFAFYLLENQHQV